MRVVAVVHKDMGQRFDQFCKRSEVVVVANPIFLVQQREQRVMKVVAPLRVDAEAAGFARLHDLRIVQIALGDQHHAAAKRIREHFNFGGQLLHEVNR